MIQLLAVLVLAGGSVNAQTITNFGSGAYSFSMEFVMIGNPNNVADTRGAPNPVGSVSYVYNLGKHEVSRDMVIKASTAGGLGLTLADIWAGNGGGYGGNDFDSPATGISWNEAARFVNWLNTSKGYQAAYKFTATGPNDDITPWSSGEYNGTNRYRHKDAHFFIPSEDEWYKAAYGDINGNWYKFPTGSDALPSPTKGGTNEGTAVFGGSIAEINRLAEIKNAGGLSGFGTMGQGGNAYEWVESSSDGENDSAREYRTARGGAWASGPNLSPGNTSDQLESSYRSTGQDPMAEMWDTGFRVAMVPEPSSLSLLLAGGLVALAGRRKC